MTDKICFECRFFGTPYYCNHPKNTKISPTFGRVSTGLTASDVRWGNDKCGPKGKWWEPASKFRVFMRKVSETFTADLGQGT